MSTLKSVAATKAARIGVALSLVGVAVVGAVSTESAQAATTTPKATVAPSTGPTTVGSVLSITGSGFATPAGAPVASQVAFQTTVCTTTVGATKASVVSVVSATHLVATAPALSLVSSKPTGYNVCIYDSGTTLLGAGTYTVYAPPTISAANSPASGSVAGGDTIVVTGTNFTKKSVVKFGTTVSPKVTVAANGNSLTAVVPAHTAGQIDVSVTTEGGTNATPGTTTWDDYTYTNAVTVSPHYGLNSTATTITVTGVGFKSLTFGSGAGKAAVMFVPGAYAKAVHGVGGSSAAPLCTNVQVVSDTELVCVTPSTLLDMPYIVTVVGDQVAAAATPNASVVSSSAAFTFAAF